MSTMQEMLDRGYAFIEFLGSEGEEGKVDTVPRSVAAIVEPAFIETEKLDELDLEPDEFHNLVRRAGGMAVVIIESRAGHEDEENIIGVIFGCDYGVLLKGTEAYKQSFPQDSLLGMKIYNDPRN